jgi:hypothetical protein
MYAFRDPSGEIIKVRLHLPELVMEIAGEFADADDLDDFDELGWSDRITSRLLDEGYELLNGTFKVTKRVSLNGGRK